MSPEQTKALINKANHLRQLCNTSGQPTHLMIDIAWDMRKELAEFAQEVKPDIFTDFPDPEAVDEDGFPAPGNKVYHPIVDKCFHQLVKGAGGHKYYPSNLAWEMRGIIESGL